MPFTNKDERRAYHKAWYWKNRESIKARITRWNAANPARVKRCHDVCRRKKRWIEMIKTAKDRAAKQGIPFDLTNEWGAQRWTGFCELTGLPFDDQVGKGETSPRSPSIDKIIPALGYVQTNCRFVLIAVNMMKGSGTDADVLAVAQAIVRKSLG